jgi:transglutaminase-like putative cysteine protease
VTLRRTAYELAFENWRSASALSREAVTREDTPSAWPNDAPLEQAAVALGQLNIAQLNIGGPWQQLSADTLYVVRATLPVSTGYWLPPQRSFRADHARDLRVEPLLEVEEPAVKALAIRLRAGDPDPRRVAAALSRWIADSISHDAVDGRPSALEAIRSRSGDARRHTNLFVALSRSLGMPARRVSGVLVRGESVRPWQWAEVLLGDTWVPADPSLGAFPTDAGHVRLFTAVTDSDIELERLIARLNMRAVVPSAAPPSQALSRTPAAR